MSKSDSDHHRIDQEILKTLESLDSIDDVEAGPYFYARLKARLEGAEQTGTPRLASLLLGGRLAPALLTVVLLLNVFSAVVMLRDAGGSQIELRQLQVEAVADEYLLAGTSSWLDFGTE